MKAGFSAFLALTALALALALGLGLYLGAAQDHYAFAAADERGEASAAEGVVLRSEAELGGDLCLTAEYSPASGENESSSRWIAGGRPREYGAPELKAYSDYSLLYEWRGGGEAEIENPVHLALYTELRENHASGENSASARLLLNDFTKRAPIIISDYRDELFDAEGNPLHGFDLGAVLPVPLPGEVYLNAEYELTGKRFFIEQRFCAEPDGAQPPAVTCASLAAGEWFYFSVALRSEETGELLDGSDLPGGGWGVWRVRCEPFGAGLKLDFASIERVLDLGEDWEGVWLDLSGDGSLVLAGVLDGEGVSLVTLDAASGAEVQRLGLLTNEDLAGIEQPLDICNLEVYSSDAGAAFVFRLDSRFDGEGVAVTSYSGGRYTLEYTLSAPLTYLPDSAPRYLNTDILRGNWQSTDFLTDGERLFVLYDVLFDYTEDNDVFHSYEGWYALSVWTDEGCQYTQWFNSGPDRPYRKYSSYTGGPPWSSSCELILESEAAA